MNCLCASQKEALEWIISIFEKHRIPWQIAGGLAAKIYGSSRPLNDIDIDIPKVRFPEILDDVKEFITYGPIRHLDEKWDVYVVTLQRNGQEFDISVAETAKVFDDHTNTWIPIPTDPTQGNWVEYEGMRLSVIPRHELITYKNYLNGDHQRQDINSIRNK